MPLKDLQLKYEYRSDATNIVDDFYVPCLTESTDYWRAVGYFTSQGITLAAKGLSAFIAHEGHMRLVASPILDKDDIEAFEKGYSARESIIEHAIIHDIDFETVNDAPELVRHRLACLAWLIAENRLDIKIAVPLHTVSRSIPGIYHEKVGIFFDSKGDVVAFTGSPNETVGGLVSNFESFDVFMSWDDQHERTRRKIDNFENLWNNATQGIAVLNFPEAAKQQILRFRPSSKPSSDPEANLLIPTIIKPRPQREIGIPRNIDLRYYQREASEAWLKNNGRGFLSMATGSGKTITALASVIRLYQDNGKIFVVVVCPFQHLVDQWNDESIAFGFQPILAYQSRNSWEDKLNTHIVDYNLSNRNIVFVITTHSTFISNTMQRSLSRIKGLSVIVADEVHHLGAEESRENLPEGFTYRMGLSATPERWFDEEGTDSLKQYFGETIYEFPLKDAIREGCLCEYNYYPHLVELTTDELEEYEELTNRIAKCYYSSNVSEKHSALEALLRKRANILNKASNKITELSKLINGSKNIHHALFYCVSGQIDQVIALLGNDFGLRVHSFTVNESSEERRQLLRDFSSGEIQALVAIKCLDEGVDVPSTQVAYILASSSNPREFIQRRGRILRNSPGKEFAIIHDLITVPSLFTVNDSKINGQDIYRMERNILKKELLRFREFADASKNPAQATQVIWEMAKAYNVLDF